MRAVLALCLMAGTGFAHGTESPAPVVPGAAGPVTPFPIAIGGPYTLTDQHGRTRTQVDPDGKLQLLFFGYANCQEICSAALPQMAEVAAALSLRGVAVTPVMITVDPERDTAGVMATALLKFSQDFIGLTGDAKALSQAYKAFSVDSSLVLQAASGPVYAHGSLMYLLDGTGEVLTLIPPILSTGQVVDLVARYAAKS